MGHLLCGGAMALDDHALVVGEARIIGLKLTRTVGEDKNEIYPDSATISAVDADDESVITEIAASVSGSGVYSLICAANITEAAGVFTVTWKIVYGTEIIIKTQTFTVT